MPHIVVKMIEGRDDLRKQEIADALTRAMMAAGGVSEEALSVAIEEVPRADWMTQVFEPEIKSRKDTLWKKPGYADV